MAMENKRIIQLNTERTTPAADDYVMVDSATAGTAKYLLPKITDAINQENSDRASADTALQTAITNEATARTNADTTLQGNITAEATARVEADTAINGEITQLKEDLNQAIEDFAVPTQEAVDNWLNEHPEATTTVQDGSITDAKLSDALKLKAINDYITPEMFGAKGDGVTDDTLKLQDAMDYSAESGMVLVCDNTYKFSDTLHCTYDLIINGLLAYNGTGTALYIGKSNANVTNKRIKIRIRNYGSTSDTSSIGVKLENVFNSFIDIDFVENFYKGVVLKGNAKGAAYNKVNITNIHNFYCGLVLTNENNGWTNENSFYNGRFWCDSNWIYKNESVAVLIDSDDDVYYNNDNTFYSPSLEGNSIGFLIAYGYYNRAIYPRMEGVEKALVTLGVSYGNMIDVGYGNSVMQSENVNSVSSQRDLMLEKLQYTVFDSGDLSIDTANSQYYGNAPKLVGLTNVNNALKISPMLYHCVSTETGLQVTSGGLFCIVVNTIASKLVGIGANIDGGCRVGLTMFDSNGAVIEKSPTRYGTSAALTKTAPSTYAPFTYYITGSNGNPDGTIYKVPDECVKCAIMFVAVGNSFTAKNVKIKSDRSLSYDCYSNYCVSNVMPTSTGKTGQVVFNNNASASGFAWVYYNNAWNAITA